MNETETRPGESDLDRARRASELAWRALEFLNAAEELQEVGDGLEPPPFERVSRFAERCDKEVRRLVSIALVAWRRKEACA